MHRSIGDNLGDLLSAPYLYFPELGNLVDDIKTPTYQNVDACVVGGGALLSGETKWGAFYNRSILKYNPKKIVVWGAGLNGVSHNSWVQKAMFDNKKIKPDIAYVRDYKNELGIDYAPDVSCMNSVFSVMPENTTNGKILCISHPKRLFNDFTWAHKHVINKFLDIRAFVETVMPFEYIVTSCYHPALWSTWLNKKVIVSTDVSKGQQTKKVSTYKLTTMRHKPVVIDDNDDFENIDTVLSKSKSYPTSLDESRRVTKKVWEEVSGLLFQ
tara:strand:- start:35 stop:844 length:810 start_codon:yes stop_codon:yes gene_type:complete